MYNARNRDVAAFYGLSSRARQGAGSTLTTCAYVVRVYIGRCNCVRRRGSRAAPGSAHEKAAAAIKRSSFSPLIRDSPLKARPSRICDRDAVHVHAVVVHSSRLPPRVNRDYKEDDVAQPVIVQRPSCRATDCLVVAVRNPRRGEQQDSEPIGNEVSKFGREVGDFAYEQS